VIKKIPENRPYVGTSAWRGDSINKSHSQATLPMQKIDVRSQGS